MKELRAMLWKIREALNEGRITREEAIRVLFGTNSGNIDLSWLDFRDEKGHVFINNMRVNGMLDQSNQMVSDNLYQSNQNVKGDLYQANQYLVKGKIYNDK